MTILMKEIRCLLMGKKISHYNGWNGSHDYFSIGHIENAGSSVCVFSERGKGWGIFIPKEIIPKLLQSGIYTRNGENDHCNFTEKWHLS